MIQFIAGAAVAGALSGALLMGLYKDVVWKASVTDMKIDAANLLIAETDRVIQRERDANAKVRELESSHVQKEKDLSVVQRRNRELATQLGGLRDPGRRASCPDALPTATTGAGPVEGPASTGQLSGETSEALLAASIEVDAIAEYARVCYEYKETVKTALEQKEEE